MTSTVNSVESAYVMMTMNHWKNTPYSQQSSWSHSDWATSSMSIAKRLAIAFNCNGWTADGTSPFIILDFRSNFECLILADERAKCANDAMTTRMCRNLGVFSFQNVWEIEEDKMTTLNLLYKHFSNFLQNYLLGWFVHSSGNVSNAERCVCARAFCIHYVVFQLNY